MIDTDEYINVEEISDESKTVRKRQRGKKQTNVNNIDANEESQVEEVTDEP